jgi:hypothetical protein
MSALSVQVPFPVFQNSQGQPLEDGYVWIGQANLDPQVNPINVYWDAALTISAAQPIRTLGGYPSNSGTPARLYVNSDYSIRVMNKNGSVVYSAPVANERLSADLVSYQPAGTGAVATTVQNQLRKEHFVSDFSTLEDAITAATGLFKLLVNDNLTVRIPTDSANLQTAVDCLSPNNPHITITLNIESGHSPQSGCTVINGDYSQFRITATDAEVVLSPLFGISSAYFVRGENARMPRLECLVNANSRTSEGYSAYYGSTGYVAPGCGIKNAYNNGLAAYGASMVHAENTIWTGCATNGATGAGLTSWGSIIYADGADVSDSNYYGAQAAHGGILNFDSGRADRCFRYGLRGSDGGYISADSATANDCGIVGNPLAVGYGFYAFNNSFIAARDASATGCASRGVVAAGSSIIHAKGGTFTAAQETGCFASDGSIIDAYGANVSNCKKYGIWASTSSSIAADALVATGCGTGVNDAAVLCEKAARVSVGAGNLANCVGIAVFVQNAGAVNAIGATLTGAGNRAAFCASGSSLNVSNATATGAGVEGIRVAAGSNANIQSSNFQRGVSTATTDIIVDNGSFINAAGATGGTNQAVNTLTAEGVIFR